MSTYTIKYGESINDVVLNTTGTLVNLDAILTDNDFDTWTPRLVPGQILQIPDTGLTIDQNTRRQLKDYPAANNVSDDIYNQINAIFDIITDTWVVSTGYWRDDYLWKDDHYWIDEPLV